MRESELDLLWEAVTDAVEPIAHMETQLERHKLEKRMRDYFTKGTSKMSFASKSFEDAVQEYSDNVFHSLFTGLGDRDWLMQADLLLVIDAGVKDLFPSALVRSMPQNQFERVVLQATDRSFDKQRYFRMCYELVEQYVVEGKPALKKVRECLDTGRDLATKEGGEDIQAFVNEWTKHTINAIAQKSSGDPESVLAKTTAEQLFLALLQEGGLPVTLEEQEGIPDPNWPGLKSAINGAYAPYAAASDNQRYFTAQYTAVEQNIQGAKTRKKVRECMDMARELSLQEVQTVQDFVSNWTFYFVDDLAKKSHNFPQFALPILNCISLFEQMMQSGGLPSELEELEGLPPANWAFITEAVHQAYAPYPDPPEGVVQQQPGMAVGGWEMAKGAMAFANAAMGKGGYSPY